MDKKHYGSTLNSLLEEIGALQEANERLSKRIFVGQLREAMKRQRISLSEFARRMNTSRTAARRLLDHTVPGVTLGSLVGASSAVGMAFEPRLTEAPETARQRLQVRTATIYRMCVNGVLPPLRQGSAPTDRRETRALASTLVPGRRQCSRRRGGCPAHQRAGSP
jgi:antitoxin HicB